MLRAWTGDSSEPLYVRLKHTVRTMIATQLKPGDRLPSEGELCEMYGVSRTTVRQALSALADEGVVSRQQGRGSFVTEAKKPVDAAGDFIGQLADAGRLLDAHLISLEQMNPDERVVRALKISFADQVHKVRRVWLLEERPFCYQVSYIPVALLPGLTPADLEMDPAYGRPHGLFDATGGEVEESVEVMLADQYRAQVLAIPPRTPLLAVDRIVHLRTNRPGEYNRSFYDGRSVRMQLLPQRRMTFMAQ
ncbi:GntR family transcriptional regulator [Micromonospora sp. NPDC005305]|uniref:GntR family transcriptional regulator n=1 Tax=Micromonospora sp. NPDC005305 TaxID=3156875 RepID=UPI0033A0E659